MITNIDQIVKTYITTNSIESEVNQKIKSYLKENIGATLADLTTQVGKSEDYVDLIVRVNSPETYRTIDNIILLNGLGRKLCAVCGEEQNKSVYMFIPNELLKGKDIDDSLLVKKQGREESVALILGHHSCYEKIDLIFRLDNTVTCADCLDLDSQNTTYGPILERCIRFNLEHSGAISKLSKYSMCNHFTKGLSVLFPILEDKDKGKILEQMYPEIEHRTTRGYKNLIAILEKAKLIR